MFTNLVFSLLTANSGRSLFEVAAAITAHPVVAKKIRKIKRNPHVSVVTRFVATASDFVSAHVPAIVASAASVCVALPSRACSRLTCVQSISVPSLKSSAEPEKLNKLEAELTKLREEIGLLMQAKLQLAVRAGCIAMALL